MENLTVAATNTTPEVVFDFEQHHLRLRGESHPEDVTTFYRPILQALNAYLDSLGTGACRFDFEFVYFNSSTAKIVMTILDRLDETARGGAAIDIHWFYDDEDDTMLELGEEFGEDIEHARFQLEKIAQ